MKKSIIYGGYSILTILLITCFACLFFVGNAIYNAIKTAELDHAKQFYTVTVYSKNGPITFNNTKQVNFNIYKLEDGTLLYVKNEMFAVKLQEN